MRLRGLARVLDNRQKANRTLRLLNEKHKQYTRKCTGPPVLTVDISERRPWSAARETNPSEPNNP